MKRLRLNLEQAKGMQFRKCRTCDEVKDFLFSHLQPIGKKRKIFKDKKGSTWNGGICPDCEKVQQKQFRDKRRVLKLP